MIIYIVHIKGIASHEPEDNTPIPADPHGIEAFTVSSERVKV